MTENDVSSLEKAPKITSMINLPTKSKLSEINKSKDKENSNIFEPVKRSSTAKQNSDNREEFNHINKHYSFSSRKIINFEEKVIDTSLAKQMRRDRADSIEETKKFNEERKLQWERALTRKL